MKCYHGDILCVALESLDARFVLVVPDLNKSVDEEVTMDNFSIITDVVKG